MDKILAFFKEIVKLSIKNNINLNKSEIMVRTAQKELKVIFKKDTLK